MPATAPAAPSPSASRWRSAAPWAAGAVFLPVAFVALVLHANEYRSWGGSGVDCNGPMLLAFAWPAAVVYTLCGLLFLRRAVTRSSWTSGVAAAVCALLVVGLGAQILAAHRELADPDHRLVCGS